MKLNADQKIIQSTGEGIKTTVRRIYYLKKGKHINIDNRWVVPYNKLLWKNFKAHINVENCNSKNSIKYVCKYINKGSDMTMSAIRNIITDEVTEYQLSRYIGTNEAFWKIFDFPIHERFPAVFRKFTP